VRFVGSEGAAALRARSAPGGSSQFLDHLLGLGRLDAAQHARVAALAAGTGDSEVVLVARLGLMPERELAGALAQFLALPLAGAADYPQSPVLGDRLSTAFLRRSRVMPLFIEADAIALAMIDPTDAYARDAVRMAAGKPVKPWVAVPAELEAALARFAGETATMPAAAAPATTAEDAKRLAEEASDEPVIRYVAALLTRAAAARASDIHLETAAGGAVLRLRVDGVLREAETPPAGLHRNIVSRVKVLAGVDIAERRLPQDGRFRTIVEGREIDVRVSIVPTLHGDSLVLRLLDRARAPLTLPELGFGPAIEAGLQRLLETPHGMLLATGPTGSGKTSTLYAALQLLNTPARKILTVEDPVEYQMPGLNQIPVRPAIGLSFATLLRSLLRQDPDVLLVGEIRDVETARIATQASLTGHLVLSTVHTNDAPGTLTRLQDMGLEGYLLVSVLRGVLAQRLVRRLCQSCREEWQPSAELADQLRVAGTLWRARGCAHCGGTGYHGRLAVAELLVAGEDLSRSVLAGADAARLRAVALEAGMVPMRADALAKAEAGLTSLDEVMRVAGDLG
jgi:general secretion pathway protein E